ncbi:MAG TPA: hypothetical protein VF406_02300, partial [Thermodesulfobacteriota bacterium]
MNTTIVRATFPRTKLAATATTKTAIAMCQLAPMKSFSTGEPVLPTRRAEATPLPWRPRRPGIAVRGQG